MKSVFGKRTFNANEKTFYFQSIYQNIFWRLNHQYKTGITFRYDILEQHFELWPSRITEAVPGAFFEYTYSYLDKLTVVSGVRADLIDYTVLEIIPRLHAKYNFTEDFIFRISAGKSLRQPYPLADHISALASSRQIVYLGRPLPERAWNYGINFTRRFTLFGNASTFSADLYRTAFIRQLVADTYTDSSKLYFRNSTGESYSNSMQFTFGHELLEQIEMRLAYKYEDVESDYNGTLREQPLISRNRGLASLNYSSLNKHWKVDITAIWEGSKKLPKVFEDADYGNNPDRSPSFTLFNFQLTKVFRKFEVYGGSENILDYRQLHPIINADNPFGNSFDATNIWGPIAGRRIYAGLRYSIK
jgi:outer membrane receptor for ferrienterochelin and colicins